MTHPNARDIDELASLVEAAIVEQLEDHIRRLTAALRRVDNWARAYSLEVFPEPDFKKARDLLEAGGISLDAVSASNMRHVIEGVGEIVRGALAEIGVSDD